VRSGLPLAGGRIPYGATDFTRNLALSWATFPLKRLAYNVSAWPVSRK
jgi:hypothetical protein